MNIDHNTFPRFTVTPASVRHCCADRTGPVVGAYAAEILVNDPSAVVRFKFRKHNGKTWEDLPGTLTFALEEDENEKGAVNLRMDTFGGHPAHSLTSEQVASCAVMGERFGRVRRLNPMLMACTIQSYVDRIAHDRKACAFLDVAA